jgi:HD-like signal output (HDOD) protein
MKIKAWRFQPQHDDCRVQAADLKRLDLVRELLQLLNDPYVGPMKLSETITHIPVFAARCRREAALYRPRSEVDSIERALNVIGNRGIEKVLFELLEDLTILKSDLEGRQSK